MKKSLLALSLAAILLTGLTGCDNADKIDKSISSAVETSSMAVDVNHSLVLDSSKVLWAAGESTNGEFGIASTTKTTLTQIATDVVSYAKGENFTLIVKTDGSLWATGANDHGQLGLGNTTDISTWTQVLSSGVESVAAGDNHALIVKTDGTVWAAGANTSGQLGLGNTTDVNVFTNTGVTNAASIEVSKRGWTDVTDTTSLEYGIGYSAIIKDDGSLWVAGANGNGQLGLGTTINANSFTNVTGISNVKKISLGAWHSALLTTGGDVYVTGDNWFGQLANGTAGLGTGTSSFTLAASNATDISAGLADTIYVGTDGYTYGAGDDYLGILGNGNTVQANSFTKGIVSGVSKVYAGRVTTLILTTAGDLYAVGDNYFGQFGNGTTTNSSTPVVVTTAE